MATILNRVSGDAGDAFVAMACAAAVGVLLILGAKQFYEVGIQRGMDQARMTCPDAMQGERLQAIHQQGDSVTCAYVDLPSWYGLTAPKVRLVVAK